MDTDLSNSEKLTAVFAKHGAALRAYALELVADEEAADELLQIVALWALSTIMDVTHYTLRMAMRERAHIVGRGPDALSIEEVEALPPVNDDPMREHAREEALFELKAAYQSMSALNKSLIREIVIGGRPIVDVAAEREVPESTIRRRLGVALEHLEERFKDEEDLRKALALPAVPLVLHPVSQGGRNLLRFGAATAASILGIVGIAALTLLITGPKPGAITAEEGSSITTTRLESESVVGSTVSEGSELTHRAGTDVAPRSGNEGTATAETSSEGADSIVSGERVAQPRRAERSSPDFLEQLIKECEHPDAVWREKRRQDGSLERRYQVVPSEPPERRLWGAVEFFDSSGRMREVQHYRAGKEHGPYYLIDDGEHKLVAFYLNGKREDRQNGKGRGNRN